MQRVLVVCAAGASSTFLARRLSDLAAVGGFAWSVSPAPVDTVTENSADVVAITSHVSSPDLLAGLDARGVRFVVLPDTVRGGFGAEDALTAIAAFLGEDGDHVDSTVESDYLEGNH